MPDADFFGEIVAALQLAVVVLRWDRPPDPGSFLVVHANAAAAGFLRVPPGGVLGTPLAVSLPEVIGTGLPAICAEVSGSGRPRRMAPFRYGGTGTQGRVYESQVFPMPDRCVGIVAEDITERWDAQEQLRLSEALQARAQQIAHVGSFRWDAITNRVTWSEELHRIYGRTPKEFAGTFEAFLACVHPDDRAEVRAAVEQAVRQREAFRLRERIVRPDGEIRFLDSAGEVVLDAAGQVTELYGVCRDVTEERQAELAYRELSGRLLQAQDAERRRIARELHNTTSPLLAALVTKLHAARQRVGDLEQRSVLEQSLELAEDASSVIRTVAYLLHPPLLDDSGLVASLRWYLDGFAARTGLRLEVDFPERLERLTQDAEIALFRIVQECLTNILSHSGSAWARVRLAVEGSYLTLEVRDGGRGVPADLLERLRAGRGEPGIGVSGMRERMRQLGGRLDVDSSTGGVLVSASLPLAEGTPPATR